MRCGRGTRWASTGLQICPAADDVFGARRECSASMSAAAPREKLAGGGDSASSIVEQVVKALGRRSEAVAAMLRWSTSGLQAPKDNLTDERPSRVHPPSCARGLGCCCSLSHQRAWNCETARRARAVAGSDPAGFGRRCLGAAFLQEQRAAIADGKAVLAWRRTEGAGIWLRPESWSGPVAGTVGAADLLDSLARWQSQARGVDAANGAVVSERLDFGSDTRLTIWCAVEQVWPDHRLIPPRAEAWGAQALPYRAPGSRVPTFAG
jgi:hypothetical protein